MSTDAQTAYAVSRAALMAQEKALSHHHVGRPLTAKETLAIECVSKLRSTELTSVWTDPAQPDTWLGMPFPASKAIMEKSQLFSLIRQMPKGAILHCHLDAMNDPYSLLRLALSLNPTLCISACASLRTEPDSAITFATVTPSSPSLNAISASLHSSDYLPNTLIPAQFARAAFPGGPEAFDAFVVDRLTVNPKSVGWSHKQVWDHFQSTFHVSSGLIGYGPVFEEYIYEVFMRCAEDNVPYLECRIDFLREFYASATGLLDLDHRVWVQLFQSALKRAQAASTPEKPFWGAKIIYSTIRFIDAGSEKGQLRWFMEDCIALKKEFPDLIIGFDLVGWEDGLKPLSDYIVDLLWFKERVVEDGVDIPYLFHAGETLGDGSVADINLYDAILLDTKRIGHGFSLVQHPLLMDLCRERGIAVECCPISNELLRYTASTVTHPLAVLLNNSVPVALACDDPQFFGNFGLSYDFYQVFTSSEQMTILGLGKLARQSIEYSMMEPVEKKLRLTEFDVQFSSFLDLILSTLLKTNGA